MTPAENARTRINSLRSIGPDTCVAAFETPPDFGGYPGQFVRLTLAVGGDSLEGYYTISSAYVEDTFAVTFDTGPDSEFGRALANRQSGAPVGVVGPFGEAYYEGGHNVVVLASGPGLGAGVGICRRATAEGHDATLVYRDDQPQSAQLRALDRTDVEVSVVDTDSDLLDPSVGDALDSTDAVGYVYGYSEFVTAATEAVRTAGRNPDDLLVSNFG